MSFASFEFIVFFQIFAILWPFVRKQSNPRWIAITVASFIFYGWWDWRFLFLLIGTGLVDFLAAIVMERSPVRRTAVLWVSISMNIGCLAFFKYLGFLATNFVEFLAFLKLSGHGHIPSSCQLASAFTHFNR